MANSYVATWGGSGHHFMHTMHSIQPNGTVVKAFLSVPHCGNGADQNQQRCQLSPQFSGAAFTSGRNRRSGGARTQKTAQRLTGGHLGSGMGELSAQRFAAVVRRGAAYNETNEARFGRLAGSTVHGPGNDFGASTIRFD